VHSRRASGPVLDRLEARRSAGIPILHWFSGPLRDLDRAIEIGCWFSVGPAMLRGERGRALVRRMPRERTLTESDGPFAQIAGKSVMPWAVDDALKTLSELWSLPSYEAHALLSENLRRLIALSHSPNRDRAR